MNKEEAEKKYLACKGLECPFCKSKDMQVGEPDAQDTVMYQHVSCADCDREWIDEYTLTGVVINDEPSRTPAPPPPPPL